MSYLDKPLSIGQSNRLLKFFTILHDLGIISETTFSDTAGIFDDYMWEQQHLSWEVPPPEWFSDRV